MYDPVYLQMTTEDNNNKFYNMKDNGNGTFTATWGRVGTAGTETTYNISDWESKKNSKLKKGYIDVSHLHKKATNDSYKPVSDKEIQALIDDLMNKSRQYTGQYYDSNIQITTPMLDKAQEYLDELAQSIDRKYNSDRDAINDFNKWLLKLYTALPRKMNNVRNELITNKDQRIPKMSNEQSLIDNLRTQATITNTSHDTDILTALNISVEPCNNDDLEIIKKALVDLDPKYKLKRAWRCHNNQRDAEFDDYLAVHKLKNDDKTVKYYWHGTRTENVFSIMVNGLQLNPTNAHITGKMFGHGIYSAPKAQKSIGYTSLSGSYWASGRDSVGYMFLNAVITGHKLVTQNQYANGIYLATMTGDKFNSQFANYHSVYAKAGTSLRNDEVIVYNQSQVAARFLVEIAYR